MTAILAIFRKDLRRLWPQVLAFAMFLLTGAFTDPVYSPFRQPTVAAIAWAASLFVCWYLVTAVVHQEGLVGPHQSWRTCPYPPGALPAAKLVFVFMCVNVPLLLMQAGAQTAVGIPMRQQVSALLWRQLFISVFVLVPLLAIGVSTGSLVQSLTLTVAAVLLFQLDHAFHYPGIPVPILIPDWDPEPSLWLRDALRGAVCLAFGSAILYIQYFRRIPFISNLLLAAWVLLALMTPRLIPQSKQVALQSHFGSCSACGKVRASLDSTSRRTRMRDDRAMFRIPIRIEGLPGGLDPFTPDGPAELWCDGRRVRAFVRELPPGQSWLVLDTSEDQSFFSRYAKREIDLDGSIDLKLFKRTASVSMQRPSPVAVPGAGVCSLEYAPANMANLLCYTPAREAALAIELPTGGREYLVDRATVEDYSPTSFQFEPLQKISRQVAVSRASVPGGLRLIAEQPVFHQLRAPFHIHAIRLADFLFRS